MLKRRGASDFIIIIIIIVIRQNGLTRPTNSVMRNYFDVGVAVVEASAYRLTIHIK